MSEYKTQKEFESKILTASFEELEHYVFYKGVKTTLKNGLSIRLAAQRGDVKIFELMLTNHNYYRKMKIPFPEIFEEIFKNNNVDLLTYIMDNIKEIDYNYYLHLEELINRGIRSLYKTKNLTSAMIEALISHENFKLHYLNTPYSIFSPKELIFKRIIDEKRVDLFLMINEKGLKYQTDLKEGLINYSIKENKFECINTYLENSNDKYMISRIIIKALKRNNPEPLFNYKNKKLKLKELNDYTNLLEAVLHLKDYTLIKKFFDRKFVSYENKKQAFLMLPFLVEEEKLKKKLFKLFMKEVDLNEIKDSLIYRAMQSRNKTIFDLILEYSDNTKFKGDAMGIAVYEDYNFNKLIKDERFEKDVKDLRALRNCIMLGDLNKLKQLISFKEVTKFITSKLILELFEDGKTEILIILMNQKHFNLEKFKEKIKDKELLKFCSIHAF